MPENEKKETKKTSKVSFKPTAEAKRQPRRVPFRKTATEKAIFIAIGGEIVVPANPPKRGAKTTKEASQAQMKFLYDTGHYNLLIEKTEA